ncbi:MAG TPA: iron-sulfur cluster repair di-iron protein [Bacteroidia bacterium]|nr:iron-sulfur cluster repair di-iron protein [Bacteroidia bacterium]
MKIENLSLAEIITERPQAAALLEKYDLDFCCRGKLKLSDQIKDQNKLAEVIKELEEVFSDKRPLEVQYGQISLTELVDHILEKHHRYVKENLSVILEHLEKVAYKHGDSFPEMKKISELFREVKRDFEQHMMKEEVILFPGIKAMERILLEGGSLKEKISIQAPVHVMEAEHETAGKLMDEIKNLSNHYTAPENACMTFRLSFDELKLFEQDLHQHVHLENNILFPKALKMQDELSRIKLN